MTIIIIITVVVIIVVISVEYALKEYFLARFIY